MSISKSGKPAEGVHCVVSACTYHSTGDECLAGPITIGDHSAKAKSETDCETFVKKDGCGC